MKKRLNNGSSVLLPISRKLVSYGTFNKTIYKGRNLFPILILLFSREKQETMTATETSCFGNEKNIIVGNCISANKRFSSIVEDPLKQEVCTTDSSDRANESSSNKYDSRLVVYD